jgi:hypothetical protein
MEDGYHGIEIIGDLLMNFRNLSVDGVCGVG